MPLPLIFILVTVMIDAMGVGLILLWPVLFFLEGGDDPRATEYSRLKGERDAVEKVSVQKKCGIQFQTYTPSEG